MYEKYEEAADSWRHEMQQRRHAETLLQRVSVDQSSHRSVLRHLGATGIILGILLGRKHCSNTPCHSACVAHGEQH